MASVLARPIIFLTIPATLNEPMDIRHSKSFVPDEPDFELLHRQMPPKPLGQHKEVETGNIRNPVRIEADERGRRL
jgi:hypothetical protein